MQNENPNLPKVPRPSLNQLAINEPIENVDASVWKYINKYYATELRNSKIAIATVDGITIAYFLYYLATGGSLTEDAVKVFVLFAALPWIVVAVVLAKMRKKVLHAFYKQFAGANGFTYQETGWLVLREGAIFKVGHSANMQDIIEGELNGLPIKIFNYSYAIGSGKSQQNFAKTILEINLKTPVPPMLLLVDAHAFGDNLSDNNLKNVSKIDLGGDFEKNYNLFSETKFETEALQIFTPEFLTLIHQKFAGFSLDFVGEKMYVYALNLIMRKSDLDLMFEFAQTAAERLGQRLPGMKSSITAMHETLIKTEKSEISKIIRQGLGYTGVQKTIFVILIVFGVMLIVNFLKVIF